ncbi:MAG: hypothetical protein WA633_18620 [Stellaceae bacterium]
MRISNNKPLADDLVLGIWAAISLLGDARQCPDMTASTDLVYKAELILSRVIPHVARCELDGSAWISPDAVY